MSYILEALKKADRERSLGDVPDLETAHWGERSRRRPYRWVWVVVALLLVNGALLAVLLGRDDDPDVAGQLPKRLVPGIDTATVKPPHQITRPREPVYMPPAVQTPGSAAVQQSPMVTTQPVYTRQPAPVVAPVAAPASSSGVPYWDDLPLEYRSGLVLPHIDVHVYSEDPARRFILVELQKYREGEALENGAVVEVINEDSIQLYYQGTRFLMER
jgi:general secretion pathway protein B